MCDVGVESTVITLAGDTPRVLRPGGVTVEQLAEVLGKVDVDDAVLHKLADGKRAASPGMKYKHYAPKANVKLLKCSDDAYIEYITATLLQMLRRCAVMKIYLFKGKNFFTR